MVLAFCPDRLAPDAVPEARPDDGVWMAHAAEPLDGPVCMGRLMEH